MTDTTATAFPPEASTPKAALLRTPAAKVGMIIALIGLLQIPFFMVSGLIGEREARQDEVLAAFRRGWGPEQSLTGPMLVVPYSWTVAGVDDKGISRQVERRRWIRMPPSRLKIAASLQPETRRRGLFHATVYTASVEVGGTIGISAADLGATPGAVVDWSAARLVLGASDLRGLPPDTRMEWNGGSVLPVDGDAPNGCGGAALLFPAGLTAAPAAGTAIPFKTVLALRGTQAFRVLPLGRQVEMEVSSPWTSPSFVGGSLPLRYEVGDAGFTAAWQLSGDANAALQQRERPLPDCAGAPDGGIFGNDAAVGVELQEAVPTYLMVSRAAKYGVLFLALSYLTLFLFEMLSGLRIHLVQYGLLGLSIALFGLLLVSIAEPLGFTAGYAISTLAVLGQASLYTLAVVKRAALALVFAGVLGGLFAFLYVVLSLDAYALLAGTVALFAILSVVMRVTRQVNWSGTAA